MGIDVNVDLDIDSGMAVSVHGRGPFQGVLIELL